MKNFTVIVGIFGVIVGVIVIGLGITASEDFFEASNEIEQAGSSLTTLRSVSGDTVAEAYYQEIGQYGISYSIMTEAAGYATLMLSFGLGGLLITFSVSYISGTLIMQQPATKTHSPRRLKTGGKVGGDDEVCPACNASIKSDDNFCPNCAAKLQRECKLCGEPSLPKWTICPQCGQQLDPAE